MIGYRISLAELRNRIEADQPGWLGRAAARTAEFRNSRRFEESSSIWSEVKPVYMKLQGDKCAYCERRLEAAEFGRVEQDVEHFRPKGNIRAWKIPASLGRLGVQSAAAPARGQGYYLLAYHPFNYASACKPCNSSLKRDCFPIAGDYDLAGDDPAGLGHERPFLIYPIGDFDTPPEDLISFRGISPRAVADSGHDRHRALVTIEFFKLDDLKRKNLLRERAWVIVTLHIFLEKLAAGAAGPDRMLAQEMVKVLTSPQSPHANCGVSFRALYERDPAEAKAVYETAAEFYTSIS